LEQGHLQQAKETFERVLAREPENSKALAGLREVLGKLNATPLLTAAELLQGVPEGMSLSDRKAFVLRRYLGRLRHRS
jgi:thioredoxin-like negative regulator of GroEL